MRCTRAMLAAVSSLLALSTSLSSLSLAQDKLKVAVGSRGTWDPSISELAQKHGHMARHGLDIDVLYTDGSGETMQATIAGSVDIGLAVGTFGVLSAYAKGAPIRIIGSTMTGVDDQYWYAKAGSQIKAGRDLAGRTVGYSTFGASTHAVVMGFQRTFGVALKPTVVGAPVASMTMVLSGQVDVGWSTVPLGLKEIDAGLIQIVARANEVPELRNQSVRLIVSNLATLTAKRDAVVRFMRAYRETVDWLYDKPEGVKAYVALSGVPEAHAILVRDQFTRRDSVLPDRIDGIDPLMADAIQFKFLSRPLDATQLAELIQVPLR